MFGFGKKVKSGEQWCRMTKDLETGYPPLCLYKNGDFTVMGNYLVFDQFSEVPEFPMESSAGTIILNKQPGIGQVLTVTHEATATDVLLRYSGCWYWLRKD